MGAAIKLIIPERRNGSWSVKAQPDELPDEAWTFLAGAPEATDVSDCYRFVPVLYRGVNLVCNAVSTLPFEIRDSNGEIVDSSTDYQNRLGFLPSPAQFLWRMEASSYVFGSVYVWRERLSRRLTGLRVLAPDTVTPQFDPVFGLVGFKRQIGGVVKNVTTDDLIYFWRPDPHVEIGPPTTTPVKNAVAAAMVLRSLDDFARQFFARGAIRATLLTVDGPLPPEAERQRLRSWWQRVISGIRNAFAAEVVSAAVKPVVVGEGLAELNNRALTDTEREHIAIALGIPMSVLFSQTASGLGGGGVARQDDLHFYDKTIIPEAEMLAGCLNDQLFGPLGYRFKFMPEWMSLYQEDEKERAQALTLLVNSLRDPVSEVALSILRYGLSAEMMALLRSYWQERKSPSSSPSSSSSSPSTLSAPTAPAPAPASEQGSAEEKAIDSLRRELARWERKAVKRLRDCARAYCDFDSQIIPPDLADFIKDELQAATSVAGVKRIFEVALVSAQAGDTETATDHVGQFLSIPCPLCGSVGVDCYPDHGGLCVCRGCKATFDPELER